MLLIHRSVDLHQQVADVEKSASLSEMIGPHFLNQADVRYWIVLNSTESRGNEIFLISAAYSIR